ncbi:ABC transporter permease [Amycolatopsis sp. lyj-109]|uniref:ABC transporter permease n=1 Tax=Amycolatopsis sp. lyj-109 TaxID=2789287 RepID=UPI00397C7E81
MTRAVARPVIIRFPYRAVSWLTPVAVLALWELLAQAGILPRQVLPAPSSVVAKAGDLIADGELPSNLLASLQRSATGFAIGASLGLGSACSSDCPKWPKRSSTAASR